MTDSRASRTAPRRSFSALEGRLYLVAILASGYLVAWRGVQTTEPTPREVTPGAAGSSVQPAVVWIESVPREQRPALTLPAGWRLAVRGEPTAPPVVPAVRIARTPPARPVRVRTRSS
ncbi:MAG: hypothetical protein IPQ07_37895 [Myxococcales bacterium]|nr:hypothetical protein [Myxococcales bacterium]